MHTHLQRKNLHNYRTTNSHHLNVTARMSKSKLTTFYSNCYTQTIMSRPSLQFSFLLSAHGMLNAAYYYYNS